MSHQETLIQRDISFVISSFLSSCSRAVFIFVCQDWHDATCDQPKPKVAPKDFSATPQYLKWAHDHGCSTDTIKRWVWSRDADRWTHSRLAEMAAKKPDLQLLTWIFSLGISGDYHTTAAAAVHGLAMLRATKWHAPYNADACAAAAENDHLDALQWLHKRNCPWDQRTCAFAAKNGHLDVLKWARTRVSPPCPWDWCTFAYATINNHRNVLVWLAKNAGTWECFVEKARKKNRDPVCMIADSVAAWADIRLVVWARARISSLHPQIAKKYKLASKRYFLE